MTFPFWFLAICGLLPSVIAQSNPISILPYPFPSSGFGGLGQFFRPQQFPLPQFPNGQQLFGNLLNPFNNLFRPRPTAQPTQSPQPQPGPGQNQPVQNQPGQNQPVQNQPGQTQPVQNQPGQTQPVQNQPVQNVETPLPINSIPQQPQNQLPPDAADIVPPNIQGAPGDYFQLLPNPPQVETPSQSGAVQGKTLINPNQYPELDENAFENSSSEEIYESIQHFFAGQPQTFIGAANPNTFPYLANPEEGFVSGIAQKNSDEIGIPSAELGDDQ